MSDTYLSATAQRARELAGIAAHSTDSVAASAVPPSQLSHLDRVNALRERLEEKKRAQRDAGITTGQLVAPRERAPSERAPRERATPEQAPRERAPREAQPAVELSDTLLGEGATARVWLAYFGDTRTEVAAKVVSKKGLDKDQIGWIREEIAIHKRLRHPNICTLHGSFESLSTITICLSLCRGGSLVDMMGAALDAGELLAAAHVHGAFVQLLSALRYLESVGIVHRDIKLDNLVWADAQRTRLQLIDFGYASTTDVHSQYSGSAHFAAPEVHAADEGGPPFSCRAADVWSAGVVLFAMLATALPFNGAEETAEERAALRRKVCKGVPDGSLPAERPAAACDLVTRMLIVEPAERATLAQVLAHEWVGSVP